MVIAEAKLVADAGAAASNSSKARLWWVTGLSVASMEASSFLYNLYSVVSFGAMLNVSLFAVFTYSNLLSLMCTLYQHPWGTSMRIICAAGSLPNRLLEQTQATFPESSESISRWLSWNKTTWDSVSYLWKSFMITVICLARHHQMWQYVREQLSEVSVVVVGGTCVLLAAASVWRLREFDRQSESTP
jgi:hypothetical protein